MLLKLLLFSFCAVVYTEKVRYDDFALYKIVPENEFHVQFLKDLQHNDQELDFWNSPTRPGEYVSVVAPPEKKNDLHHSLKERSIYSELILENIQE